MKVCSGSSSCTLTVRPCSLAGRSRLTSTGATLIEPASSAGPSAQPPPGPENHTSARVPSAAEDAERVARGSTSR